VKHSVIPFPAGARQGELCVHVALAPEDNPDDAVEALAIAYERHPISEVIVAPGELTGPRGRAFGLSLRRFWEIAIIGAVRDEAWPMVPSRLVLNVSSLFAAELTDEDYLLRNLAEVTTRIPPPTELFAIVPAGAAPNPRLLHILNQTLVPEFGSTLYVELAQLAAAVAASIKVERPWSIRPLGAFIPLPAPTPAASPAD
jgi:hypothetical protein